MFTIKSALSKLLNSGTAKEKKAFTLVETLVTLVIIGVVSAVIIPNVVNKCQDIVYANKWKKIYSVFSQATTRIIAEGGMDDLSNSDLNNDDNSMLYLYLPYIKTSKICKKTVTPAYGRCWHDGKSKWSAQNKSTNNVDLFMRNTTMGFNSSGLVTIDGVFVVFVTFTANPATGKPCHIIAIDVNGFKAPNVIGRDIFGIFIYTDGSIRPAAINDYGACDKNHSGWGCSEEKLLK
jgi:prepilin-type N-terminal cleavage/methylation domain-containing protein